MAARKEPQVTAFFVAVLAADSRSMELAEAVLTREFGKPTDCLPARSFTSSSYYQHELGPTPLRAFFAFETTFHPGLLASRKVLTNSLEEELALQIGSTFPRPVNLDPGYLALEKVVLASAKNFSHRIYLSDGIYGEVTLQYVGGKLVTLPWTFPDYGSGEYDGFFLRLRKKLYKERG